MSFIIKSRRKRAYGLNEPLRHEAHKKPVTRRDFLAQGFLTGAATIVAPTMLTSLLKSGRAGAAPTTTLTPDILSLKEDVCNITGGAGKIPFICFDLAGGASIAGSNVLVGTRDQLDTLSVQGYSKLGLPGGMVPDASTGTFVDTQFGLAFHTDSAFLRGMLSMTSETTRANCNGAIIPARSENDTGNNPHNPMYGIARAGAKGELLTLIGSQNSESGGNSMAPASLIDPENRPTKIDRASDVRGLVDTGDVAKILRPEDTVRSLETMALLSKSKVGLDEGPVELLEPGTVTTALDYEQDVEIRKRFLCGYVKTADTVNTFSDPGALDPAQDPDITAIFGPNFGGDGEFQKTASVMKLVIQGNAGAGTISMGGFDYHTGERATGEIRDFRAGQCMGACLEYAARQGKPLMLYVFSDGSLSSNGAIDDSVNGRGKGVWTGDNQQTAASFFLVYNPTRPPELMNGTRQIGYFRRDGDVETASSPAANSVNLLVQTVLLNYMALHSEIGLFTTRFGTALGNGSALDNLVALGPICNGTIGNPV
ncbi:MAG: general secretion pathway protein GspF [Xanthomonadaceae bacterium]|nr:general secretion pathway protein GspF [Xanthomonadaceae bacterium]